MKDFEQLQQNIFEAKISKEKIDAFVAAFDKAAIKMQKYFDDHKNAGFTEDEIDTLKKLIKSAKSYTDPKIAADRMKLFMTPETALLKVREFKKKIDEYLAAGKNVEIIKTLKPLTICEILKQPEPKILFTLIRSGAIDACNQYFKMKAYGEWEEVSWFHTLEEYAENFKEWFDQQGGSKRKSVNAIRIAHACKGRADWTKFKGKAYRGLGRSLDRIKRYDYTGDMVNIEGTDRLVSTVKYKSKYGVQSWTPSIKVADDFFEGGDIHTILETELADEAFLNPNIINKISTYKGENEVLRVSDSLKTVTAYVSLNDIIDAYRDIRGSIIDHEKSINDAENRSDISAWTNRMFGRKAAEKLMKNKRYLAAFKR